MRAVIFSRSLFVLVSFFLSWSTGYAAELQFQVSTAPGLMETPVSGRLFVFVSENASSVPIRSIEWFNPKPLLFFRW